MIRINLLPPEYAAAQSKREQQILFGSSGAVVVVFLILFWMVQSRRAAALERQIVDAEAELKKFQSIISQIDSIEASKQQMIAKRDVIKNLNRSRLIYPVFFEDLLPIIPSDVWITNLQINELGGGPMKITLISNALSNFAVATWLTNLQQSTHFSSVELSPISYSNQESGSQTLSFSITCVYQHKGPFPLSEFN